MSLLSDIRTFVDSAAPGQDGKVLAQKLHDSGVVEIVSGALSIKAHAAAAAVFRNGSLPTRLSADAYALIPVLEELRARGILTGVEIHTGGAVTLQEIT